MCQHGDTVPVMVLLSPDLSHTGRARWKVMPIDKCIAPLVEALQVAGINMRSSCCGHGKANGEIILEDGRILQIVGSE